MLAHDFGPDTQRPAYTYLKGDITAAYSAKAREVKRSQVFLNLGGTVPAALIVFDRVTASNPDFKKYWLLQTAVEPSIEGNSQIETLGEQGWSGKLWNTTLLPRAENLTVEKIGGPGKEFFVFGKNYPDAKVPPDPEMGGWRIQVSPKQPAATDLFLNVMQVMDRSVTKPLAIEKIESNGIIGVKIADRVVVFAGDGPISFKIPGAGTIHLLVTDLAEGQWQVSRDGVSLQTPPVGRAGTLYVEGASGSFTLDR